MQRSGRRARAPDKTLEQIVAEVSLIIRLQLVLDRHNIYRYKDAEKLVYMHQPGYEDDLGIKFSKYQFELSVSTRPAKFQDRLVNEYLTALKKHTVYPLLVTEDTQLETRAPRLTGRPSASPELGTASPGANCLSDHPLHLHRREASSRAARPSLSATESQGAADRPRRRSSSTYALRSSSTAHGLRFYIDQVKQEPSTKQI